MYKMKIFTVCVLIMGATASTLDGKLRLLPFFLNDFYRDFCTLINILNVH